MTESIIFWAAIACVIYTVADMTYDSIKNVMMEYRRDKNEM